MSSDGMKKQLVMNTDTGRVFLWTEAIAERPNIRLLREDEAQAYLDQVEKEAKAREAANPKMPDNSLEALGQMLKGMTAEAIAQFVRDVSANAAPASAESPSKPSKLRKGEAAGEGKLAGEAETTQPPAE